MSQMPLLSTAPFIPRFPSVALARSSKSCNKTHPDISGGRTASEMACFRPKQQTNPLKVIVLPLSGPYTLVSSKAIKSRDDSETVKSGVYGQGFTNYGQWAKFSPRELFICPGEVKRNSAHEYEYEG